MNSKQRVSMVTASIILSWCWWEKWKEKIDNQSTKKIQQKDTIRNIKNTLIAKDDSSSTQYNTYNIWDEVVDTFDIKDLIKKRDPLLINSKRFSLVYMLWKLDVNEIIRKYNPNLAKTKNQDYDWSGINIKTLDTIIVPRIFPSMKDFFKPAIEDFLIDKPQLADSVWTRRTVIIVAQRPDKKMWLWFYNNGILEFAWPVSIGNWTRNKDAKTKQWFKAVTPQWVFQVIRKDPNHRSTPNRDAMPNFLEINAYNNKWDLRWLWRHGWQYVDWLPHSHGCIRFVHLLTKASLENIVWSMVPWEGTPFIAQRVPFPSDLDSIKYYTKLHPELAKERISRQDTILEPNMYTDKIKKRLSNQEKKDSLQAIRKYKSEKNKSQQNNIKK